MSATSDPCHALAAELNGAVAGLVPQTPLLWRSVPGCRGLRGFFLEEEAALRPLPPERVGALMEEPPFWALLWPAGERLCRLLCHHPQLVRGRSVQDFGCGCGLVACAAAAAGARVTAVDRDPWALKACRLHAVENGVEVELRESPPEGPCDLLILADFLYDRSHLPLFSALQSQAEETLIVDSRLDRLDAPGFEFLGECAGRAVPDLDPHREFGRLRFWYRGFRKAEWARRLAPSAPVAQGLSQC
jgi:predicted nicotinamide N-methyase